jgi:hypothetical protein
MRSQIFFFFSEGSKTAASKFASKNYGYYWLSKTERTIPLSKAFLKSASRKANLIDDEEKTSSSDENQFSDCCLEMDELSSYFGGDLSIGSTEDEGDSEDSM